MIVHVSKNAKGECIGVHSTLEIAKAVPNVAQVAKVDTDQLDTHYKVRDFLVLIGLTDKALIEELITTRLDAPPEDPAYWHPCADYGDGAWVIYNCRRHWAEGKGNRP